MKKKLTQERIKELLDYNPDTGIFTNKIDRGRAKKGKIAGGVTNHGYCRIVADGKTYQAHVLAFFYMEGYFSENQIDHKDRDRLNNKWNNLREVSQSCNSRNCNIAKNNKSGVTGVNWDKKNNKWNSQINIPSFVFLGRFEKKIDAVVARWKAEIKYNFPNCNTTSSAYVYLKEHGFLDAERIHKVND